MSCRILALSSTTISNPTRCSPRLLIIRRRDISTTTTTTTIHGTTNNLIFRSHRVRNHHRHPSAVNQGQVQNYQTLASASSSSSSSSQLRNNYNLSFPSIFIHGSNNILDCYKCTHHNHHPPIQQNQQQQIRWMGGRKSGASADDPKPRRWSKKQKKRFRRNIEKQREIQEKHSPPGSKAGKRREYLEETQQELLQEYRERLEGGGGSNGILTAKELADLHPLNDKALEYTADDAILDDLIGNSDGTLLSNNNNNNNNNWTSQRTPEPIYYGHQQKAFYNRVVDQMEIYHEEIRALSQKGENSNSPSLPTHLLPTDKEIAYALKAYRDQQGTRTKPIGIAKALHHVLKDLNIPSTTIFGEYTYNALLSCCRTPKEGLRVFEMMQQQQQQQQQSSQSNHEISVYSWAILMDIHAKVGDFEGCLRVLDEMYSLGYEPNLAAYTSLLAACYKVCNDGRIAHSIRAKAGNIGWEKWQELNIKGLNPDVMTYGAIIRLCAARGQPERCLNLLEEMPRFDIQPTTLCFSSALKAVAKSHETAIRYQRGWSRKNKRRERITAHHGKMARNIVLMAEAANVEIDDGFISALQLCAAAAGDSATAKAIYLADKVRRNLKHWRQIGGDDHLARLRGEDPETNQNLIQGGSSNYEETLQLSDGEKAIPPETYHQHHHHPRNKKSLSYGEREYGTDTRTMSAILRACAQAADSNGVGKMWSGRENYGYLDLTSLRLIQQYRQPEFHNTDIPGATRTEVGMGALVSLEDIQNPRKRTDPHLRRGGRQKFPGMVTLDDVGKGLDDLPDEMYDVYFDEDGMLKQEYIDSGMYPEYERIQENERRLEALAKADQIEAGDEARDEAKQIAGGDSIEEIPEPMYFCMEERRWKTGHPDSAITKQTDPSSIGTVKTTVLNGDTAAEEETDWYFDPDTRKWASRPKVASSAVDTSKLTTDESTVTENELDGKEEWYFDNDDRRWKTRIVPQTSVSPRRETGLTSFEEKALQEAQSQRHSSKIGMSDVNDEMAIQGRSTAVFGNEEDSEESFHMFFQQLRQEVQESGEEMTVDEAEARELFALMSDEFSEEQLSNLMDEMEDGDDEENGSEIENDEAIPSKPRGRLSAKKPFSDIMNELKEDWGDNVDWSEDELEDLEKGTRISTSGHFTPDKESDTGWDSYGTSSQYETRNIGVKEMVAEQPHDKGSLALQTVESFLEETKNDSLLDTLEDDFELQELKELLPGMPVSRLMKVRQAYMDNLSDPSLLTLVPILRERMPDWFTTYSIRASNIRSARYILAKAEEAGVVDTPMLNGMLQVYASCNNINNALQIYDKFDQYKLTPTAYTNRLVVQMFLKKNKLSKCLEFKQQVEERGQKLDLLSYGALMEFCSRHKQLGSAMMILKECIATHGAHPGESYLKDLRTLCRRAGMEEQTRLEEMIGEDPIEWLRHGEAVLKREKSKRGNRDINLVANALVRA